MSHQLRALSPVVVLALTITVLGQPAVDARAFSTGPPNGRTGAPGESNCTVLCHSSFPLNSGTGSLTVSGIDGEYVPGVTYPITVSLSDPVAQRWGFELTVLDAADLFAGALTNSGNLTQVSVDSLVFDRTYIKHTSAGTAFGTTGSHAWQFEWTAPEAGAGPVTFYVAGNAANGNFLNTGDRIYTRSFTFGETAGTSAPPASGGLALHPNRPNPFNPATTLSFTLERPQRVRLDIYDLRGQRIRRLVDGTRSAGRWELTWNGRDEHERTVASGTYLVRVETEDAGVSQSIVLVR